MLKQGIYEEIITKKLSAELRDLDIDTYELGKEKLDVEEARKQLSAYISQVTRNALKYLRESESNDVEALLEQIKVCNEIISLLSQKLDDEDFKSLQIEEEGEVLTSVYSRLNSIKSIRKNEIVRPVTPISQSSLFTGSNYEPNMLSELKKEILTSDHIEMLVSFIKWSGLRCIIEELQTFTQKGGTLRVITTSYMEATDFKAIEELGQLANTEIKVSYDVERTRLHAKAYLFNRETGFSTAYIGSSNLSNPALTSGLEWNMKITEKDSFDIIKKFEATFESYWNDKEFQTFDYENIKDIKQLKQALSKSKQEENNEFHFAFDIRPFHYQNEILEKLQVEREVFGRYKNLVVAATGVGKTVISAFDYKRFYQLHRKQARLLFVAHREEILRQSRDTFRGILKDANFGDLLVGNHQPLSLDHLFVSIQSYNSKKLYETTSSDFYDFIIVDEFHHAASESYQRLLNHYQPNILLGLTATPERMDGKDILGYFDDTIAADMRLTEAVNQKLLSPFQYFCVSDTVDLSKLKWSRKGYDIRELENVYTSNDLRTNQIIKSIHKYVTSIEDVKGLGFCVSVEHAKYMASYFNKSGISALSLYGDVNKKDRMEAQDKLLNGDIRFIFVVDLYNEGIDIPEVNTVLFLRPTESLTVFLQQLGRGLRLSEGKDCLTVLDFVGQAHQHYNFEEKFKALVGKAKHSIQHYVENGFFNLPKGCFIQLEKQAKEYILRNIKASANTKGNLIAKMKYFEQDTGLDLTLHNFLNHYHLSLYDFYGKSKDRSFVRFKVIAEEKENFQCENESFITSRLPNLLHINSKKLLEFMIQYIEEEQVETEEEQLMQAMFYYSFYQNHPIKEGFSSLSEGLHHMIKVAEFKAEILAILHFLYQSLETIEIENEFDFPCPLQVHSKYSTAQVLAALGYFNEIANPSFREGVKHFKDKGLDVFFTTLNKSEKDFSPSTLYDDYAINETLFHWQTQSKVAEGSETAKRYISHRKNDHKLALFVREYKKEYGLTSSFIFLGMVDYVKHSGSKPVSFVWRLHEEMPSYLVPRANKNIL
ncbi:DEAD/DEAH box helicase [Bacillus solitudinis]|uniref:DEAD/DEAH box helicase n=1 Tax=Bacillus solitudinis TaxID=2014074 RepID=UPI000C244348|nr:DEAD/DEAH box helicase [Bacillus solitudinis]